MRSSADYIIDQWQKSPSCQRARSNTFFLFESWKIALHIKNIEIKKGILLVS